MWNALAGYAGLVSVGQQMFFGLGAYAAIRLSYSGMNAYAAIIAGALLAGCTALPLSSFILRLRGGEFAIATNANRRVYRAKQWIDDGYVDDLKR